MVNLIRNRAFQILLIMLCAVGIVALIAFSMGQPQTVVEGLPDGTDFELKTNTQLEFEDLRIGAGNFRVDNCENIPCSTSGLWIYYKDRSELDRKVRVQAGDTFTVGSYQIRVITVTRRISNPDSVRLSIKNISSPQATPVADLVGKVTKIKSVTSAMDAWWNPDGKIVCQKCILKDGTLVEWGEIDPKIDRFTEIPTDKYQLSPEELELLLSDGVIATQSNDFSPTFDKMIAFDAGNRKITAILLSRSDRSVVKIPFEVNSCSKGEPGTPTSWSSDGRFIVGLCMTNFDEAETAFLIDIDNKKVIDLRELVQTESPVNASFSPDGKKLVISDSERSHLFLVNLQTLYNGPVYRTLDTNPLLRTQWASDGQYIFYDLVIPGEGSVLSKINVDSSEVKPVLQYFDWVPFDPDITIPSFKYGSWTFSPDNKMILFVESVGQDSTLWIYHVQD